MKITVSAPGKLHLLGEHTVVYGKPALLTAVDKRTTVSVSSLKENYIRIVAEQIQQKIDVTPEILVDTVNQLKNKRITNALDYALLCIHQASSYYQKEIPSQLLFTITSTIPVGSGMGSSAALAVAIAGAMTVLFHKPWDLAAINAIAFSCEQFIHGNPSGGDNSICCYGGYLWYRKETEQLKIMQQLSLSLSKDITKNFRIIFTGRPVESTGEMVTKVKSQRSKLKSKFDKVLDDQEYLTRSLFVSLKNNNEREFMEIIKQGEKNLETLGVVSSSTKKLIRAIEENNGAAKISGAGGIKNASGVVLAYHNRPSVLDTIAQQYGLEISSIRLGDEGVRHE